MSVNLTLTKDYRKNERFHPKKQTQSCQACVVCEGVAGLIKPNFFKGQNERKRFFTKGL